MSMTQASDQLQQQIWATEQEILDVIHQVCTEHGLRYSLAYGTLIGAVRHKGFIPWDDDIDLMMPREDYEKLLAIWNEAAPKGYILQTQGLTRILRRTSRKSGRIIRPSCRTRRNGRSITTKAYSLIFSPVIGSPPASWRKPFNTLPVRSTCCTVEGIQVVPVG